MQTVTITSAIALSAAQRKTLVEAIEKKVGKVTVKEVVDSSILGGVKVTLGSTQIDASVATKLDQLQLSVNA